MLADKLKGAGGSPITFEFVDWAEAGNGSTTITVPAAAQAGDWAVIICFQWSNHRYDPSGWTLDAFLTNGSYGRTYNKVLDGTETSVQVYSSSYTHTNAQMAVFRPSSPISNVYVGGKQWFLRTAGNVQATIDGYDKPHICIGAACKWLSTQYSLQGSFWDDNNVTSATYSVIDLYYELQNEEDEDRQVTPTGAHTYSGHYGGMYSFD